MTTAPAQQLRPEQGLVPPHDIDAETYVLSACLIKATLYDVVRGVGLEPDMFYADRHKIIFRAIGDLHEQGSPIDIGTVGAWLREREELQKVGGSPYLVQISDLAPAVLDTHVEAYAKTVRDKARLRYLVAVLRQHAAEAYGTVEDTQGFLDAVEANVSEVARRFEGRRGLVRLAGAAERAYGHVAEAHRSGKAPGVPYGLELLDRKTGGMGPGDLIVVAGRPGMGKTAFVAGTAVHIASQQADADASETSSGAVAFFSLEMSAEQLALRSICSIGRLDSHRIRSGMVRGDEWPRLVEGVAELSHLPIWVDDTPGVSVADIRSRCRKLKADLEREREKDPQAPLLKLVVIDYLQLMAKPARAGRDMSREQEVSANTRASKELAKELGCPVLLLSQLNRGVEQRGKDDKRPHLADLRESGAIEQDADQVLFIYRDEYYYPDTADRGIAEMIVAKQRNGPAGTVKVRFTGEYTRFDDLAREAIDDFDDFEFQEGL